MSRNAVTGAPVVRRNAKGEEHDRLRNGRGAGRTCVADDTAIAASLCALEAQRLWRRRLCYVVPRTEPSEIAPSLWDVEFAKQLAAINEQPFENGFEEMTQWTKEEKLWEFPINNEAGFNDDGSEFHEHVFLDKYLEDFPKQGPICHFIELVTCGLYRNPYLSVKQYVEHIEWFRNYFNEKQDILKESDIVFNYQNFYFKLLKIDIITK